MPSQPNRCPRLTPAPLQPAPKLPPSPSPNPAKPAHCDRLFRQAHSKERPPTQLEQTNDRPATTKPAQCDRPFRKAPARLWTVICPAPASIRPASTRLAQASNHSKAAANFCQHEQCDRQVPQAFIQRGLCDGKGDLAWVWRCGSKRSYRYEGTRLCDRESKALVLAIDPEFANRSPPSPKPMQVCGLAASGCRCSPLGMLPESWVIAWAGLLWMLWLG